MAGHAFDIYLAWSNRHLAVEANTTALNVLLAAGITIEPGCQPGDAACVQYPTWRAISYIRIHV